MNKMYLAWNLSEKMIGESFRAKRIRSNKLLFVPDALLTRELLPTFINGDDLYMSWWLNLASPTFSSRNKREREDAVSQVLFNV